MLGWMNEHGIEAATLAVARNRRLVYERGYGYQDEARTEDILPQARMRLATNSVPITKRALRQLIADGQLAETDLVYQVVNLQPWQGASYASPAMQQITIGDLVNDRTCLVDHATSVHQLGQLMGLGRNPTPAESIQYLWTQSSTMVAGCTPGSDSSDFSHYSMEIGGYIIAKTANPALDDADPTSVGTAYGDYVETHVGDPIGAKFFQAENLPSLALEDEIWYESNELAPPDWNRYWDPTQPAVEASYAIDFYSRPGSGTVVSSARDFVRFLNHYFHTGEPKPADLSGIGWEYLYYGSLPGTVTVTFDKVWNTGDSLSFVVLANERDGTNEHDEIAEAVKNYLYGVAAWPAIDLFEPDNLVIEAEDYDSYYDTTPGNTGGACYTGDDVDKEVTGDTQGGGCNVGWTAAGEWLEYGISIPTTQTYDIGVRVAADSAGKTLRLEVDGVDVSGPIEAPANGWQSYEDRVVRDVSLSAASHVLRVVFDTGLLNLNSISLTASTGGPICGDGTCSASESCTSCAADCTCPVSACTCPSGCDNVVNASVPFEVNGSGEACYFFSGDAGSHVNSWNASRVDINGADITNQWLGSSNYPGQVDGGYYVYSNSSSPWGHLEVK